MLLPVPKFNGMTSSGNQSPAGAMDKAVEEERREDSLRQELAESLAAAGKSVSPARTKSIARAQKLINKLKRFTETDKDLVIAGLQELDVSMYLTEITAALCDVSLLRLRDVPALVAVSAQLQCIYGQEFHGELLTCLRRQQETTAAASKQRLLVRLVVELVLCGVVSESEGVLSVMLNEYFDAVPNLGKYVASCRQNTVTPNSLPASILTWVEFDGLQTIENVLKKYAKQVFGLPPPSLPPDLTYARELSAETQKGFRHSLEKYARQKSVTFYLLVHEALFEQEYLNQQMKVQKGALDSDAEIRLASLQGLRERVISQVLSVVAILGWPYQFRLQSILTQLTSLKAQTVVPCAEQTLPPDLFPKFLTEDLMSVCPQLYQKYVSSAQGAGAGITRMTIPAEDEAHEHGKGFDSRAIEIEVKWSDSGERAFYEDIPDLKDVVPAPLLQQPSKKVAEEVQKKDSGEVGKVDSDLEGDALFAKETPVSMLSPTLSSRGEETALPAVVPLPVDKFIDSFIHFAETCGYVDPQAASTVDSMVRDFFLKQLNTKINRRKLARAFLSTSKTDLHVLPPICRFLGIIGPHFHDIQGSVVTAVKTEFETLTEEKSPYKIEQKVKNVRFLGELCKFKLIPIGAILEMMDVLIDDFNPHHIEMLCHLLESCGRFIAGTRGADIRLLNKLLKLKRLKSSKTIPSRLEVFVEDQIAVLDAACARMNGEMPSLWQRAIRGEVGERGPPMKQFIEDLVWSELGEKWDGDGGSDEPRDLIKKFRKLDWDNPQVVHWMLNAFLDIQYQVDISSIHKISTCLAKLASFQPQFVITCVEDLIERLVAGLEQEDTSQRQRLLLQSKLLVELFEDKVVDSYLLVDFIYYLMGIHSTPTPFGASHFKTVFELVKTVAVAENTFLSEVDVALPPLDFVERLCLLPPLTPQVKYNTVLVETSHGQNADISASESKTGILPNRLGEILFHCFLRHPQHADAKDDFFQIRLACYVLKCAWQSIYKRSYPWKLHMILTTLVYVVAWKSHEADDRMPVELDFAVKEVAAEIHVSFTKRDLTDRYQATLDLSAMIGEMYPLVQTILMTVPKYKACAPSAESLLANFSKHVAVPKEPQGPAEEVTSPLTNLEEGRSTSGESEDVMDDEEEPEEDADEEEGVQSSSDDEEAGRKSQTVVQFDRELDQLVSESMEVARSTVQFSSAYNRAAAAGDIRLPHHLLRNKAKNMIQTARSDNFEDPDLQEADVSPSGSSVPFILVTKKGSGGKYSMKSLAAAPDSRLAAALTKVTSDVIDDSVDRQLIKRFVMDHVDRIGAEEQRHSESFGNSRHHPNGPDDRPVITSQRIFMSQSPGQGVTARSAASSQRGTRRGPQNVRKAKDKPIREARRKAVFCEDDD
eukprot:Gregarina_sp_Poly_1__10639@NODE_79_length_15751_cov_81_561464_g67_i0_p1_GENE_NODE_79_length_15751_cov_81_561464_g67_i0NODE_79_length_15751_cov_81_561464_g67_i0_p1_ORF_typecomplete_len1386_score258_57MIF4G/PF02854_19/0_00011MIF4G/PF02854_19/1_3e22MIF4G/PF02854_19/8_8e10MIF4G/PF02854_19/27Upf2/PF04050_14/4e13DUF3080/PF11279_8/3_2e02DUF3080/PF11279_8/1_3CDC27/PF09507_10/2_8e03CDC27/PF09507_10/0_077Sigma70_ner/PF04546_13/3_1e02Sigma70_ner/PF04546_13/1_1RRN3/PF05327_11/42RRN3/PF05327_11/21_NODE_79_le